VYYTALLLLLLLLLLLCFSVWLEDPTAYENPDAWVAGWTRLAAAISKVGSRA
jgi:hypothetical protein